MNRCAVGATLLALFFWSDWAVAQAARAFTAQAMRGELVVQAPPLARLNGHAAVLAPGARIRDTDNRVVLSGSLVGRRLLVHYTRDLQGQLLDVWVLTPGEAAKKPWPTTAAEAAAWHFDAAAQTWSPP